MSEIKELLLELSVSIFIKPGTIEELMERDFLKNTSSYSLHLMLKMCMSKKWIYEKNDVWYCYKKTRKILNDNGYDF